VALVFSIVVSACSASGEFSIGTPSIENATEDLIETEIATQIGLGDLDATCTTPASEEAGTRFLCTATTQDGRTIEFKADIDEDGAVAETTNLVVASKLREVESVILAEIEKLADIDLADDALDCGPDSVIVDSQNRIDCVVTDPTGATFDTTITFKGLDTNDPTFDFEVASDPRSDT
jgi:hypothetical protein